MDTFVDLIKLQFVCLKDRVAAGQYAGELREEMNAYLGVVIDRLEFDRETDSSAIEALRDTIRITLSAMGLREIDWILAGLRAHALSLNRDLVEMREATLPNAEVGSNSTGELLDALHETATVLDRALATANATEGRAAPGSLNACNGKRTDTDVERTESSD